MTPPAPQGPWFGQGPMRRIYQVGSVVRLEKPEPAEWKIDTIIKEDLNERAQSDVQEGARSYATLKVLCHQVGARKTRAMMRIYYQIPWTNTDHEALAIRAAQATTFEPRELHAYQVLSKDPVASKFTPRLLSFGEFKQGPTLAVPGGFVTIIVWEVVPGLRLGNNLGPSVFWSRPLEERT